MAHRAWSTFDRRTAPSDLAQQKSADLINAWQVGTAGARVIIGVDVHLSASDLQSILEQDMEPLLQQSDFAGGIGAGLDRLAEVLSNPTNPAQAVVAAPAQSL